MNKAEYFEYHKQCLAKMTEITQRKNADYAGGGDDPFANFSRVEKLGICSTELGFLTRMTDKMSRLSTFANTGRFAVLDESVEDTLLDLANYSILMAAYIKSKEVKDVGNLTGTMCLNTTGSHYISGVGVATVPNRNDSSNHGGNDDTYD